MLGIGQKLTATENKDLQKNIPDWASFLSNAASPIATPSSRSSWKNMITLSVSDCQTTITAALNEPQKIKKRVRQSSMQEANLVRVFHHVRRAFTGATLT